MSVAYAVSDSRVMMARCIRRSLRSPEAFFTALLLPIVLMLLFVYVFGGDLNTGGKYVDYVVPGLIVLCAGFGAGTTAVAVATDMTNGIVDRIRSMPVFGSSLLVGHVVASLARNLIATSLVVGVALSIGWRPTASPLHWVAAASLVVLFILALSWLAAGLGILARARGGDLLQHGVDVHPLRLHSVRSGSYDASPSRRLRPVPAIHTNHRDDAWPLDGPHLHGCCRESRGNNRDYLLCRNLRHLDHRGVVALSPSQCDLIAPSRYFVTELVTWPRDRDSGWPAQKSPALPGTHSGDVGQHKGCQRVPVLAVEHKLDHLLQSM